MRNQGRITMHGADPGDIDVVLTLVEGLRDALLGRVPEANGSGYSGG